MPQAPQQVLRSGLLRRSDLWLRGLRKCRQLA